MIRTIKQRLYWVGLMPLAILAVALVVFNGLSRIDEANRELSNARKVTAALLHSPAVGALVVGNIASFEQAVDNVLAASPWLTCVSLRDTNRRVVSQAGDCRQSPQLDYFPVTVSTGGFSDYKAAPSVAELKGELGLQMNDEGVARKRRQVIFQLSLSLVMIALVLGFIGRLLRGRLIEPIQRISTAIHALSQRDYSIRVPIEGEDELTRLAEGINITTDTIEAYTRELERYTRESERRRAEADRALHDAVGANLAREGLVRSLTEDLKDPLSRLQADLTAIAIANNDPALKGRIRAVIALLQEAQGDFGDLMEIATIEQGVPPPPAIDLEDTLSDIERDMRLLTAEGVRVNFVLQKFPPVDIGPEASCSVLLNVDGVRLRKALVYLIRALGRRCSRPGVSVSAELIRRADDQLHISIHLNAFYEPVSELGSTQWVEGLNQHANVSAVVGWTDRETRTIDYLLKSVAMTPAVGVSPAGGVSVILSATYNCSTASRRAIPSEWSPPTHVAATVVSDDASLLRLTTRSDISNHELRLVSMSEALAVRTALLEQDALLIDISDFAEAIALIDELKIKGSRPSLIALCPPGRLSEPVSERLLELGFISTIQKPVHYSRVLEAVRAALSRPLASITRNGSTGEPRES